MAIVPAALRLPLLVCSGLGLLIRVAYLIDASDNPFWRELGLDLQTYHEWAQAILRGSPPAGPFMQAPLFPYLLAMTYAILGPDPARALWLHLVPGTLTVALVTWSAGTWRGKGAAWAAGLFAAFFAPAIFYTGVLLPPTWVTFCSALFLAAGVALMNAGATSILAWLGAGFLAGVLALAQPIGLALALPVLFFPPVFRRKRLAFVVALVLPLSATFLYNGARGAWAPVAVNGGINFFIGNGPDANGAYVPPPGMEENRDLLGVETAREAVEKGDSEPSAFSFAQADRYWRQQAWAAISSDPGRAVGLFGRKLLLFFGQYEVPQIESFSYEKRYATILQTPLPGMAWLAALAVLGLLLCAQDRTARWLGLSILAFAVGTALFFVTARFRLPVFPWLAVLGGAGIAEAVARVRRRAFGIRFAIGVVTACAVLALSSVNLLGIDREASEGQYSFRQGVLAERNGRTDEAIGLYRDALARDPDLAKANVNLGTLLARKGQLEEGLPFLERGAQLDAGSGIALQNLGQAYQVLGREAEARAQFEKAVLAQPDLVSARESLAYLLYAAGDIKEARQSLQTILFQAPKGSPPSLRAGTLLAVMDERTDLVKQLTGPTNPGSSVDPVWWKHPGLLQADLALAQRRMDEARRGYQAATQDPAIEPYAQNVLEQMTESLGDPK